ncbi:hypothetical protein M419DRAFT_26005 [Trichoderma reesei RUT C-30]|uniref:SSCRP protein n=1 Tax=Hypocrea jecorina (strain ATCC 56765 / BCRC 32924 / NRRL 11460 / Rut C-30) TaxID=1344414 RepID=A0A024S369_HYPJR|nr:hypothetical protein M419DRAFT_26005 [Trichoderma reesei RUT C-30]
MSGVARDFSVLAAKDDRKKLHNFASASSSDSDVSSSSVRMDANPRPIASVLVLRCMRCARSAETTTTDDASTAGMVRISHNLYYCERCAKLVGYK